MTGSRFTQNAFSVVNEAIKVAIDRNARVPECLARIVHAQLLLSGTGDQKIAGSHELERAALMQQAGAMIFKAMIAPSGHELPGAQRRQAQLASSTWRRLRQSLTQ